MKTKALTLRLLAIALLITCALPAAHAQWSWKDRDGRRIFSDQPPPSDVPDKDILKRPNSIRASTTLPASEASASTPTSSTATTSTAPRISGKDSELEKRKREQAAAQTALKKAEADKLSAATKDNCERAKRAKASFDSGQRLATVNAQGQREIMSDEVRASESRRLQEVMAADCS